MREQMFRREQWGIEEESLDDDGAQLRAMAAESWILSTFSQ
jgi:hypothetical protein